MYQFTNVVIAGLMVSHTIARSGTTHYKQYAQAGVSPVNQNTLNVYVYGGFKFEAGSFSQVLSAGDTSLDLTIGEYPTGEHCVETVLSDWGQRFCVSCKHPWVRDVVELAPEQQFTLAKDSLVVLTAGEIDVAGSAMRPVSYRGAPEGAVIAARLSPAKVIVCHLQ